MYLACRHIKPGGQRCKSPALRGHAFCYYHARLHANTKLGAVNGISLPVPEDAAAIQESLGTIFEAILSSRIDSKQTAQLLWGLQIASSNLPRKPKPDPKSVLSVTRNKDGVELAPVLKVCNPWLDGETCEDTESCQVCSDFKAIMGRDEEDTGDDEEVPQLGNGADDDEDDDDNDEEDGKTLLGTLKLLTSIKESLEQED
jgi:hypothetical protein